MLKLVAEGVPTSKEQYQLALDCAFAAGKASCMPPKPVGFLEELANRLSKLPTDDRNVAVEQGDCSTTGGSKRVTVQLCLSMSWRAGEALRQTLLG